MNGQNDRTEGLSLKSHLDKAVKVLSQAEVPDASIDAWYLLSYVTGYSRAGYLLHENDEMSERQAEQFHKLVDQRADRIPLQYLTGEQEFMGLSFIVNDSVLIPRQDTESLVEYALPYTKGKKVLDVCTGSGCIAISIAMLGEPEQVDALDLSEAALQTAKGNAEHLGASVNFFQSDLLEQVKDKYDVIVSNPPYIPPTVIQGLMPEVKEHEPFMALDGGDDGLVFYRRLAQEAKQYLLPEGMLFMEIGCEQGQQVKTLFEEAGFGKVQILPDLTGKDRVVWVCG